LEAALGAVGDQIQEYLAKHFLAMIALLTAISPIRVVAAFVEALEVVLGLASLRVDSPLAPRRPQLPPLGTTSLKVKV